MAIAVEEVDVPVDVLCNHSDLRLAPRSSSGLDSKLQIYDRRTGEEQVFRVVGVFEVIFANTK